MSTITPRPVKLAGLFDPNAETAGRSKGGRKSGPRAPIARPEFGRAAAAVAAAGLVAVIALGVATETSSELSLPGGGVTFIGSLTGLAGMYLALVMVLIVARIPFLERIIGQDGMLRVHRWLSPWPLSLIFAHAVFITVGYAQAAHQGAWAEVGKLISSYPDILAATVALGLMVAIGIASIRAIRMRMRRETWWVLHLYMYLALALSFAHVLILGPAFVGHPLTQVIWSVVWAATAGTVLVFRFGLPVVRSLRYRLEVVEVRPEAPGVTSIVVSGHHLDRLAFSGGQFFTWRFLTRDLWWPAHPYSLSAMPRPPYMRLTVKAIGDHSSALASLTPGTKVAVEGPYGAITADARRRAKVAIVAGGIGVTATRCLLEDLPRDANPVVVLRATSADQVVFRDEVAELVRRRKGTLHEMIGARSDTSRMGRELRRLIPDLAKRDLYVFGPPGLVEDVVEAGRILGVPDGSLHREIFSW